MKIFDATNELEQLKHNIDLPAFMETYGFHHDVKDSSRDGWCMHRHDDDAKLLVIKGPHGYQVYGDARNPANRGTVIDFVRHETGCNLGEARKILRQFCGGGYEPPLRTQATPDLRLAILK